MQKVMKKLFTLLLFCQALSVQANEFELQDYRRKIKPIGDNLGTALGYHRESINSLHSRLNQFQEKYLALLFHCCKHINLKKSLSIIMTFIDLKKKKI